MPGRARRADRPLGANAARAVVLLLAFGGIAMAGLLWQAYAAERSHDAAVGRLLSDYSEVATWSFEAAVAEQLAQSLERVLHPAHPSADGPGGAVDAAALLAAQARHRGCCGLDDTLPPSGAVHIRVGEGLQPRGVGIAGELPSGLDPEILVSALIELARDSLASDWPTALLIVPSAKGPRPVAYTVRITGMDTLIWGVPLSTGFIDAVFAAAVRDHDLLPPLLVGSTPREEMLALSAEAPGGESLWEYPVGYAGPWRAEARVLPQRWGALRVSAAILPPAASRLMIGESPAARFSLVTALLLTTAILLWLAVRHLRQVYETAQLRSNFVASVSHELRTPLALQRVAIDMLRLGRAHDPVLRDKALTDLDRETTRLSGLVDNILRFSQTERSASPELRMKQEKLEEIVRRAVKRFGELVDPSDVEFRLHVEDSPVAAVNPEALERALINLLENAVKYGPGGQVVTVRLRIEQGWAVFAVDDQGPGIRDHERAELWEPFRRGDDVVGSAIAGAGIGLTVVWEVARAHGGEAEILDAPGGGTRVEIRLPLSPPTGAGQHAGEG